jgi:hypothetical protein
MMFKLEEERSWSRKWQCKTELTVTGFEMQVPRRGTAMFGLRDDPPNPQGGLLDAANPTPERLHPAATRACQREVLYHLLM